MNKNKQSADCRIFVERDVHSPWYGKSFRFDFSDIRSETLRGQIKYYIWKNYRAGDKALSTLRQELSWLRYYESWLWERGVNALEQIKGADAEGFLTFLHTCISKKTGQTLRLVTQRHIYQTVRGLYRWYARRDISFAEAAELFPRDVYQRINRVVRTKSLEQEEVIYFLQKLSFSDNPCLRYGGTILAETGIAPSDLLGLETDCLKTGRNGTSMCYYHHRKRAYRNIPVSGRCAEAVCRLKMQTDELRVHAPESIKCRLFLHYSKWEQVIVPDGDLFRYWLWQLMACEMPDKEMPTLTQIRYACVQDMLAKQVPPMVAGEVTGVSWSASFAEGAMDVSRDFRSFKEAAYTSNASASFKGTANVPGESGSFKGSAAVPRTSVDLEKEADAPWICTEGRCGA